MIFGQNILVGSQLRGIQNTSKFIYDIFFLFIYLFIYFFDSLARFDFLLFLLVFSLIFLVF